MTELGFCESWSRHRLNPLSCSCQSSAKDGSGTPLWAAGALARSITDSLVPGVGKRAAGRPRDELWCRLGVPVNSGSGQLAVGS